MPESRVSVQPVQVDYTCDACGQGQMRSTGIVLSSHPMQYPHRCNHCDAARTFTTRYPKIEFDPVP